IDPHSKRRRSRRRAWRDGLADQTVVKTLEDARCYRAFERALVGSVDPRSVIELALVHRLVSLLWRLWRASAIETGLFEIQGESLNACRSRSGSGFTQPETSKLPLEPMAPRTSAAQMEDTSRRQVTNHRHRLPRIRSHNDHRTPAPWRNASSASLTLTRRCLRGWAPTKPGCGGRRHKRFGLLMR